MDSPITADDDAFKLSFERLWSDAARMSWIEPDLRPFPGCA